MLRSILVVNIEVSKTLKMIKEKYLGLNKKDKNYLELLTKANAIRNAKFIKPITREVAKKYVNELIIR